MTRHILYEYISAVFSTVSYFIMAYSVINNNSILWFAISFIYIFPKAVSAVNNLCILKYNKAETYLSALSSIVGGVIVVVSLVMLSTMNVETEFCLEIKVIFILFSTVFIIKDFYVVVIEIKKLINLQNQIRLSLKDNSKEN